MKIYVLTNWKTQKKEINSHKRISFQKLNQETIGNVNRLSASLEIESVIKKKKTHNKSPVLDDFTGDIIKTLK